MGIPSSHLIDRLKRSEGFRTRPYVCPAGRATIGYGHNLEAHPGPIRLWSHNLADLAESGAIKGRELVERLSAVGMVWTEEHAEAWLRTDINATVTCLSGKCAAFRLLLNKLAINRAGKSEGREEDMHPVALQALVRAEVLVDMAFNMGVRNLSGFRRMLSAVEAGDFYQASSEMLNSRWASQVGRRAVELSRQMRDGVR